MDNFAWPELEAVFAHECAHMRRNDFAKNFAYELFALPVLYHPLVWLTRARLAESREMVCDEMAAQVIGLGGYARSLLRLASVFAADMPVGVPHVIAIFDAHTLERRLMIMKEERPAMHRVQRLAVIAACAVLGVGTCYSALAFGLRAAPSTTSDTAHTAAPGRVSLPSEAVAGKLRSKVQPIYPEAAKRAKVQGAVMLDAVIGKEGSIENLRVISGPEELRPSSLDAVRQ